MAGGAEGTAWALMGFIVSVLYWSSLNDGALMAFYFARGERLQRLLLLYGVFCDPAGVKTGAAHTVALNRFRE